MVSVYHKTLAIFILLTSALTACDVDMERVTATPNFITATLPPTSIPPPTQTPIPPTPMPTIPPVEGITTTQLNVRAEPSTASENLGTLAPFEKVQVTARDASGTWIQIVYTNSSTGIGWVRAEYVRVDESAQIPVLGAAAGDGTGRSGLVIQKINIRSGPGASYETLGILNPNDVVFITGRDPGGAWIQIEFAAAADGKGWAALEFLQVDNLDSIPVIEDAAQTETQTDPEPQSGAPLTAAQDGDSMGSPLAKVLLSPSGARAFQISGEVSAPEGDAEDWVEFTSESGSIAIRVSCTGVAPRVELWNNGTPVDSFSLACGGRQLLKLSPNISYHLRVFAPGSNEAFYTKYVLSVEALR